MYTTRRGKGDNSLADSAKAEKIPPNKKLMKFGFSAYFKKNRKDSTIQNIKAISYLK